MQNHSNFDNFRNQNPHSINIMVLNTEMDTLIFPMPTPAIRQPLTTGKNKSEDNALLLATITLIHLAKG